MPSRPGSRASRASTPKDEESDLSDTASEAEAEDNRPSAEGRDSSAHFVQRKY